MAERQLPDNSQTDIFSDDHIAPIATRADAELRKPSVERKLRNIFISDDADSIGDYLIWSVLVPAIQGMLQDAGHGIVDGIFGRGSGRYYREERRRGSYYDRRDSYRRNNYASSYYNSDSYSHSRRGRYEPEYSEAFFRSRAKAEECLDTMEEIVSRRGYVTISHLSDLIGVPYDERENDDKEWGWYDISRCRIKGTRDGFVLEMPRPEWIDRSDRRR